MRKIALLLALVVTGCANHPTSGASAPFTLEVRPAVAGEENAIRVHDEASVSPTLQAVMRMRDMGMPPMRVTLQRDAGGEYVANGVAFSMSGEWMLHVNDSANHESTFTVR